MLIELPFWLVFFFLQQLFLHDFLIWLKDHVTTMIVTLWSRTPKFLEIPDSHFKLLLLVYFMKINQKKTPSYTIEEFVQTLSTSFLWPIKQDDLL